MNKIQTLLNKTSFGEGEVNPTGTSKEFLQWPHPKFPICQEKIKIGKQIKSQK